MISGVEERSTDGQVPVVSVVICAFALQRWEALRAAIASVERQTQPAHQTIVVVDHNPELFELAKTTFLDSEVVENDRPQGLSGARNTGLDLSRGEIVAFLDDDATAAETWLQEMTCVYVDPAVIGAGGVANPIWEGGEAPAWLPAEFYWTVGCSYRGLPTQTGPVRNPIGATMSFRREVFDRVGGFRDGIGRVGRTPLGCEETELSIRARAAYPGGVVLHVPASRVEHLVPSERMSWAYFSSRCRAEGLSKALVSESVGSGDGLSSEWTYTLKTLPTGVWSGLRAARHGDLDGLRRAAAIIAGLLLTSAAYLRGRLRGI